MTTKDNRTELPEMSVCPEEAARLLGVSVRMLAKWRHDGTGPKFTRTGGPNSRVLYRVRSLDDWLVEHEVTR